MATLSVSSETSAASLEEQWRSKIKYFKKQALEDIDLEEYIFHFKANGELLNKRKRNASSIVRQYCSTIGHTSWPSTCVGGARDPIDGMDKARASANFDRADEASSQASDCQLRRLQVS